MMSDTRTETQLRHHYEIEKRLAERLRQSSKEQRKNLYTELYDELLRSVPDHPRLTRKKTAIDREKEVSLQLPFLMRNLASSDTYLEIGAGDCAVTLAVAKRVRKAYAVEVSDEITKEIAFPENLELIITDGTSIPVPPGSINVVYSDQLMEHIHPDDVLEQLRNIYRSLAQDGRYICMTPNAYSGPHDVSVHFDYDAKGMHLKEYTYNEIAGLFHSVGFRRLEAYYLPRGMIIRLPITLLIAVEKFLSILPTRIMKKISRTRYMRTLLGMHVIARK